MYDLLSLHEVPQFTIVLQYRIRTTKDQTCYTLLLSSVPGKFWPHLTLRLYESHWKLYLLGPYCGNTRVISCERVKDNTHHHQAVCQNCLNSQVFHAGRLCLCVAAAALDTLSVCTFNSFSMCFFPPIRKQVRIFWLKGYFCEALCKSPSRAR